MYSGRIWNVLEFQSFHWFLGAVPYFDQQAVLCNAEHRAMGTVKWTVASPRANLKGISNQNQDSCYSYHSESRSDAVITRNSYMIPGIVKCWEFCGSESVLWGWGDNCFFVGCGGKYLKSCRRDGFFCSYWKDYCLKIPSYYSYCMVSAYLGEDLLLSAWGQTSLVTFTLLKVKQFQVITLCTKTFDLIISLHKLYFLCAETLEVMCILGLYQQNLFFFWMFFL